MLKFVMHMDFDSVGFLESADPALVISVVFG